MKLEDKAQVFVAKTRQLILRPAIEFFPFDVECSFVIGIHRTEDVQQGRLATTRLAHNGQEFTLLYADVHSLEHLHRLGLVKVFGDLFGL